MQVILKGRHCRLGDAMHQFLEKSSEKLAKKYHIDPSTWQVVLDHDAHHHFSVSCACLWHKKLLKVCEKGSDAYRTTQKAFNKMESVMRKVKKRETDHYHHHDNHHFLSKEKLALDRVEHLTA